MWWPEKSDKIMILRLSSPHFSYLTWETDIVLCQWNCFVHLAVCVPWFLPSSLLLPRPPAHGIPPRRAHMESNSKTYNCQFCHLSKAFSTIMMLLSDLLWFSQSIALPPKLLLGYSGYHSSWIHRQKKDFPLPYKYHSDSCSVSPRDWTEDKEWDCQEEIFKIKIRKPEEPVADQEWRQGMSCKKKTFCWEQ